MPLIVKGAEHFPILAEEAVKIAADALERCGVDPERAYKEYQNDVGGFMHDAYYSGAWAVADAQALMVFVDYNGAVELVWEN